MRRTARLPRGRALCRRDLDRDHDGQPLAALRPGAGAGGRAAGRYRRLYAHYLHTPASVARYAAHCRPAWSLSAHAKDIWTTPAWELREKLARRSLARHLHRRQRRPSGALAPDADNVRLPITASTSHAFRRPRRAAGAVTAAIRPVRSSGGRPRGARRRAIDDLIAALAARPPARLALRAYRRRRRCWRPPGPGGEAWASPTDRPGSARSPGPR